MLKINDLKSTIEERERTLQRQVGARDELRKKKTKLEEVKNLNREKAERTIAALNFVEKTVQNIRGETLRSIESVANEALQSVYNQDIRLECDFGIKRDRSAIDIRYVKTLSDGNKVKRDPTGSGCGVSDIVSFVLRMVLIKATGSEPVLIADEPFKQLDSEQAPKAASLLKYLSEKMGIQIILSSHHAAMKDAADHAHHLTTDENGLVQVFSEGV
jgi:DNA repair exonuclease SbcCD ATPase subunit